MIEERNSLVYDRFIIPVELHYYGITDDLKKRGHRGYKTTSLQSYIIEYGWGNITTTIIAEGLTRKEAEQLEDKLIKEGWERGDCINKNNSGGKARDNMNGYMKEYYVKHKDEKLTTVKKYEKQKRSTPEGKIYSRVAGYNRSHPDKVIETPLEARQKYLETGYIPSYIKNDDLIKM